MFKRVASIVAMLLVFLCGAQSMSVSAESVEEVFLTEKYSITEAEKLIKNKKIVVESNIDVLISVEAKDVVFENVEICGSGESSKLIQAKKNATVELDGVTIKSSVQATTRTILGYGILIIKDLIIEDGVSLGYDLECRYNSTIIEKTNIKNVLLNDVPIIVNQNTKLENRIEIGFNGKDELSSEDEGKLVVSCDGVEPSKFENKFVLESRYADKYHLEASDNALVIKEGKQVIQDNETPEGGDESGSGNIDPSEGESQGGNVGGDTSVDKGESGDGSDQGGQGDGDVDTENGQGGEDIDNKEENQGGEQGGENPSEGDESKEPTEVEAVLNVEEFVYDGTNQFEKVKASYVLDGATYPLGVRLFEDTQMVNAKEYTLELHILESDSNFGEVELRSGVGKIVIKKRDISVSLEKDNFVYSGSPVELKPIVEHEVISGDANVELVGKREINAGTYEVRVDVGNDNYSLVSSAILQYTIDKKCIDIDNIQTKDISKAYDGSAYVDTSYTTAGGLVEVTYLDLEKCINAGTYTINLSCSLTETASKNYVLPEDLNLTATLTISPRSITPKLQQNIFTYNGLEPKFEVELENVLDNENPKFQLLYPRDKVDVGEYKLTIRLEDDEKNYTFGTETVSLSYYITKAEIGAKDIEIRNITETYNGETIECKPYTTANSLVNVLYGDVAYKNAGTYYLTLTCTLTENAKKNYILQTNLNLNAMLTISPCLIAPSLVESTFVYSGEVPNFSIVLSDVVNGDTPPKVNILSTQKIVDVGEYELEVSLDKNEKNYKFETETVTLPYSITKAEISASEIEIKDLSKIFDGKPIVCEAYTTANGLVNVSYEENAYVNAGTYSVNLYCALTENAIKNYTLPENLSLTATLTISPLLITPKLKEKSFVYSGVIPALAVYFEEAIDGFEPKVKVDKSNEKNVGDHNVFVSLLEDEMNYIFSSKVITLTYTITPKTLTATLKQSEYEYTGYAPNVEAILNGICNKDVVTCHIDTDNNYTVGIYSCGLTLCGDDAKEYVLDDSCLVLNYSITKAEIDMSGVVFGDDEIEYTGSKYEPKVLGVPSGVKVTFKSNTDTYSVGDYIIVASFELLDPVNYSLSLDTLKMNLHITPKVVDLSGVSFEDVYEVYSGDEYTITPTNVPTLGVKMEALGNTNFVDAGDYNITYSFTSVNGNYTLSGKSALTATLHIQKADLDMLGVSLEDDEYVYDGKPHTVTLTGTLPSEAIALPLVTHINFGEYTIIQEFEVTNPNYNTPSPLSAKLTITKRSLTATLSDIEFTYTGDEFETTLILNGVLEGDAVHPSISGNKNTLAGVYKVVVLGLDNPNYSLSQTEYSYEIHKAKIDMSGVSLQDKEITYDANEYIPSLEGDLPNVVTYTLTYPKIKDVGEYTVLVSFSTDANHICPGPLTATITVSPKSVVVHFSNYSNLLYTGEVQEISCTISGMLDEEDFSIIYSNEPREVGEYTAQVVLQTNSNYVIWNSTICVFNIYANTKTTSSDEYTLTLEGGLFSASETPKLKTVTLSDAVQNSLTLIHKDISNVESFKISLDGNYDELETYLKLSFLKTSSSTNLTLYILSKDSVLQKLDYTLSDGTLNFKAIPNTVIILVEESTSNMLPIAIVSIATLFILTLSIALPLTIRRKKKRARG